MATKEPQAIRALANAWTSGIKSAKFSGICGDAAHRARGGYHISREDQPSFNYSVTSPLDKQGPANLASAVDVDMSTASMILVSTRLHNAIKRKDPRIVGKVNAFNGTLDGKHARRFHAADGSVTTASSDHLWHVHLEVHRKYANNFAVCRGIAEVVLGKKLTSRRKKVGGVLATVFTAIAVALAPHSSPTPAPKPVPAPAPTYTTPALPARPAPVKPAPVRKPAPRKHTVPTVKQVQARLHLKVDGIAGPHTRAAVKAFQRAHHLTADGKVGPKTAVALGF